MTYRGDYVKQKEIYFLGEVPILRVGKSRVFYEQNYLHFLYN